MTMTMTYDGGDESLAKIRRFGDECVAVWRKDNVAISNVAKISD